MVAGGLLAKQGRLRLKGPYPIHCPQWPLLQWLRNHCDSPKALQIFQEGATAGIT